MEFRHSLTGVLLVLFSLVPSSFSLGDEFIRLREIDVKTWDFGNGAQDIVNQTTESLAVFGQVEYSISDQFAVTAGLLLVIG